MKKIRLLVISSFLIAVLLNAKIGSYAGAQSDQVLEITEIGQIDTSGWAANVHVQDNTAFVADSESGLYIIDISDPANPTELSQFNEGIDHLHELYVDENLVYVADYTDGFKIIDVSDPVNPTQVGRFHDGGEVGTFDIFEDLAFIADFEDGLEIVNISNPTQPIEIFQYDTEISYIFNVEINNDLAYVSDYISASEKSLIILNISDLSNIEEIAEYTIDGEIFSIDFVGDVAYMMCSYGGVKIFNVSDPLSHIELGSYYDGGNAVDLEFYEGYTVIADRDDGLEVLIINDPANLTETAHYFDGGSASGVKVVNDLIFVADGEDGLEILQIEILPENPTTTGAFDFNLFLVLTGSVLLVGIVIVAIWRKVR
ncbi:MAG: hypothetical protein KAJ19_29235 [Gammaproteobacteria bacterium]|nr:hypothetical protein [Gammaproteobacteria bacterium]